MTGAPTPQVLISVTRLRLLSTRYLPAFAWHTILSTRQARRAPGCLAVAVNRDEWGAYWTSTAWRDAASMRSYRASGAHLGAMPKLKRWCDEASVAHWQHDSPALPPWSTCYARMAEIGRPSKLDHPSAAHLALMAKTRG